MERESFEDDETAAYMNENFVPVKVDREERPDVDAIYMEAVQSMTGHGGWPLTAFCDPEGVPFYGGTYFPPEPRQGMPSFRMVMEAVVASWTHPPRRDREGARSGSASTWARSGGWSRPTSRSTPEVLDDAVAALAPAGGSARTAASAARRSSRPPRRSSSCSPAARPGTSS